jgi:hypothetical protein
VIVLNRSRMEIIDYLDSNQGVGIEKTYRSAFEGLQRRTTQILAQAACLLNREDLTAYEIAYSAVGEKPESSNK